MSPQRGAVYPLIGFPPPAGFLVLTNNLWNQRMGSVGGVVVSSSNAHDTLPVHLVQINAFANPTLVMALEHSKLNGTPSYQPSPSELRAVEVTLTAALGLNVMLAIPPQPLAVPPGPVNYPLWGEVYYGPAIGGQAKRYVVVSQNTHNRAMNRVLAVRLTSQLKRDSVSFPAVSGGASRACCGDLAYLPNNLLEFNSQVGHHRPSPSCLSLPDMSTVAKGLVQTHGL